MSTEFTEELRNSLADFVRNTSDAEFYQGLRDADYDFFSQVEEPVPLATRAVQIIRSEHLRPNVFVSFNFDEIITKIRMPGLTEMAADHQDLALAA